MASPTAPTIDANGISAPQYADILTFLQAQYRSIFGEDVYLGSDSQDGQFLGIIAAAINDSNAAAVAIYNSFSPATAQGNGLSSNVKINGITRLIASNSTVDVTLTGVAGTTINNGVVADGSNNNWLLPASVTIPPAGTITVTATAQVEGAVSAAIGTITKIQTPVYGWQTVTNPSAADEGNPVETDAQLRVRQSASVALASQTVAAGILGAVESVAGVDAAMLYENDTNATDSNGLPAHSFSMVVEGGDATAVATAIFKKKTPGAYTYGTTSVSLTDPDTGFSNTIRFFRPTLKPVSVAIELTAGTGYSTAITNEIKASVAAFINSLKIGEDVQIARLYLPAQLYGAADASKFDIITVKAAFSPGTPGTSNLVVAFNERATCAVSDVTITGV